MEMKEIVNQLLQSEKLLVDKQVLWQEKTRPLIKSVLEKIKNQLMLNIEVEEDDSVVNHETIYLSFGKKPSGLYYNKENFFNEQAGLNGFITKNGAELFYSIGYRGEVIVWMSYPFVEGVIEEEEKLHKIRVAEQESIHQASIEEDIQYFLTHVTHWNLGKIGQEKIGFRINGQ